eukprot:5115275-Pyramimonas_sp.AAC.1
MHLPAPSELRSARQRCRKRRPWPPPARSPPRSPATSGSHRKQRKGARSASGLHQGSSKSCSSWARAPGCDANAPANAKPPGTSP